MFLDLGRDYISKNGNGWLGGSTAHLVRQQVASIKRDKSQRTTKGIPLMTSLGEMTSYTR
ncbi:hypothetical protein J6590_032928 [Homalodisca vitripennis]|nr:hypothetical protein J6590_032928 [Homalodisca vitripennis]